MIKAMFKNLFRDSTPKRMAGISITVYGPLSAVNACLIVENPIQAMDLTGWARLTPSGDLELELEGPHANVTAFLEQIKTCKLFRHRGDVEIMWLPYRNKFSAFSVKTLQTPAFKIVRSGDY